MTLVAPAQQSQEGKLGQASTQSAPAAPEVVIELSNEDELKDSGPLVGPVPIAPASTAATASVASTALDIPGPSAPCTAGSPDTSHDEEIARKLFVELNREAISILGDNDLVILSSDSEEEVTEEEDADEEEEENEPAGGGSPSRS
ncbi:unnamed protein product [Miscanthus lutarioriparius]|uniref:Uncharacterized protein n=1 Tax=Miscanthus lutarioriparius TaxID=422564 RepID=A0A811QP28_9POAL|nr:unnamed protein product [Miscanthus lutarioriparius]